MQSRMLLSVAPARYPFPLSKTALVAVGSPHHWPPCLAALTWLIELIKVCLCVCVFVL
jgi:SMC interacting uncharacterized protein involved in chromosome segregation